MVRGLIADPASLFGSEAKEEYVRPAIFNRKFGKTQTSNGVLRTQPSEVAAESYVNRVMYCIMEERYRVERFDGVGRGEGRQEVVECRPGFIAPDMFERGEVAEPVKTGTENEGSDRWVHAPLTVHIGDGGEIQRTRRICKQTPNVDPLEQRQLTYFDALHSRRGTDYFRFCTVQLLRRPHTAAEADTMEGGECNKALDVLKSNALRQYVFGKHHGVDMGPGNLGEQGYGLGVTFLDEQTADRRAVHVTRFVGVCETGHERRKDRQTRLQDLKSAGDPSIKSIISSHNSTGRQDGAIVGWWQVKDANPNPTASPLCGDGASAVIESPFQFCMSCVLSALGFPFKGIPLWERQLRQLCFLDPAAGKLSQRVKHITKAREFWSATADVLVA
ncbi:hypothetical protein C8R44DRAFT_745866 [Mycena epipterygia]|nr:hypothetical protein C8R44DRAFT_745866 [Mycena epipterygia]